ncbi:radical SAM protein, partial [Bacillaceae bacterium Marseille-Q3522]|nr:radical SAM protein [Bacillaceae bacterium Marseille-Q3522]
MKTKYVPSRFNVKARGDAGEFLITNLYTGAFGLVSNENVEIANRVLRKTGVEIENPEGVIADLIEGGFLIEENIDEFNRATYLHGTGIHRTDSLFLTIMPTEQCNFRCIYCYESFLRGSMPLELRKGVIKFVEKKAKLIDDFFVDWFGGEPLLAFDVIEELSKAFLNICDSNNVKYGAAMTTNGYNLTVDTMKKCLFYNIKGFQITIDGNLKQHNERRILRDGGNTFEVIFKNLRDLHNSDLDFN